MRDRHAGKRFEWVGGAPSLDFTNTLTWKSGGLENERLKDYSDLLDWASEAGFLEQAQAERLGIKSRADQAAAREATEQAHRLREALHRIFLAVAAGTAPAADAARGFDIALTRALGRLALRPAGPGWAWGWREPEADLADVLHPIAWSAAGLLASGDLALLKPCAAEDCGWLFLDRSRNRARRWCDMRVCGNNAKARRFYHRHRRVRRP